MLDMFLVLGQRDHARNVEATEIQGHLSLSNTLCVDSDPPLCISCVLGFWGFAAESFQCFLSPPKISIQGHGSNLDANPPGKILKPHIITRPFIDAIC